MGTKKISFRLGGKRYELTRSKVEEALRNIVPRPLDKYYVTVNGRNYPPKQVLSVVLEKPLVTFTTMDAQRVLSSLGLDVGLFGKEPTKSKTESETLFEEYLYTQGIAGFQHEPAIEGSSTRPDFVVALRGMEILFEVKEFQATEEDFTPGGGAYDPYRPIREKINAARKQFQDFASHCCCLVLYNREKPLVHLEWQFVFGAMLGNLAFRMPFDQARGGLDANKTESGFYGGGGKMVRYKDGQPEEPQNTTTSAIIILQQFPVGKQRFDAEVQREEKGIGRPLTLEEYLDRISRSRGTERDISLTQLRVVVCENPYARFELPPEVFRGPYDERYGLDRQTKERITRTFVGEQISELQKLSQGAKSPI